MSITGPLAEEWIEGRALRSDEQDISFNVAGEEDIVIEGDYVSGGGQQASIVVNDGALPCAMGVLYRAITGGAPNQADGYVLFCQPGQRCRFRLEFAMKAGAVGRLGLGSFATTSNAGLYLMHCAWQWNDPSAPITKITLHGSAAGHFKAGTAMSLRRRRRWPVGDSLSPSPFPPTTVPFDTTIVATPYIAMPPSSPIDVSVGRQLFVDDLLIETMSNVSRVFYDPVPYAGNPVLGIGANETRALAFSDGVNYDPSTGLYYAHYLNGGPQPEGDTALAVSTDGKVWTKPKFDAFPGTNVVFRDSAGAKRDSTRVMLDSWDASWRRWKMFTTRPSVLGDVPAGGDPSDYRVDVRFSADGIHWGAVQATSGPVQDRTTAHYNPFRKKWVISARTFPSVVFGGPGFERRSRRYWEVDDPAVGISWNSYASVPFWQRADNNDVYTHGLKGPPDDPMQPGISLYNLDCEAYESGMLGLFTILSGFPAGRPRMNELRWGFSRDGFYFERLRRDPFIRVSDDPSAWNWGNVQSTGGCYLVAGDELRFYVTGRRTENAGETGLYTMRRDGFCAMETGSTPGTLTTRPLTFTDKTSFFLNAEIQSDRNGYIEVELLDATTKTVIPGFERMSCPAGTCVEASWKWRSMRSLGGRSVQVRFTMRLAKLYAFWFSDDIVGASRGYLRAGANTVV